MGDERICPGRGALRSFGQNYRTDVTGVVLPNPGIIELRGARLATVGLVVHAAKGQRLDAPALANVEIGVFIPADNVEEEIADKAVGLGWELIGPERQRQFVAAVEQHEGIVLLPDQFIDRPVTGAPTRGRTPPRRCRLRLVIRRRKRFTGTAGFERAEASPV